VQVTVLDEADHMADLGFLPAVKRLLDATPADGQRLLFSATLDNGVDQLVRRYLTDPVTHSVDSETSPPPAMTHHVLAVSRNDKAKVVRELASGQRRSLLFTRTKYGAQKLAAQLTRSGIPAVDLHGNLSQAARARNLDTFASGRALVLVATDIAARGIHVDDIGLVVHVDPPAEHKAYLHRSGRTARAGAQGEVVTIMTPEQRRDVNALARKAGIRPTTTEVVPGDQLLIDLVGPPAAPRTERPAGRPAERPTERRGDERRTHGRSDDARPQGRRGGPPRGGRNNGGAKPAGERRSDRRGSGSRSAGSGRSNSGKPGTRSSNPERSDGQGTGSAGDRSRRPGGTPSKAAGSRGSRRGGPDGGAGAGSGAARGRGRGRRSNGASAAGAKRAGGGRPPAGQRRR